MLSGFYVIEARDLNEAIQTASRSPSLHLGSIEVWPTDEELTGHHLAEKQ